MSSFNETQHYDVAREKQGKVMGVFNETQRYGIVSKLLHWIMAIVLIGMVATILYASELPKEDAFRGYLYGIHKACGLTLLGLVILRVLWHQLSPTPEPLGTDLQQRAAKLAHRLLYLVLFVMPITGVIMSHYGGHPISFFGLFTIPGAETKVGWFAGLGHDIHEVIAKGLYVLFGLHVLAGLYHHFIRKDNTLKRMLFKD